MSRLSLSVHTAYVSQIESVGNCSSLSLSYGLGPSMSDSSGALPGNMLLQTQTLSVMMKLKDKIGEACFKKSVTDIHDLSRSVCDGDHMLY